VDEGFDVDADGFVDGAVSDCVTSFGAANTDCDDTDPATEDRRNKRHMESTV
jgi:hypothetical protein